ncbi:MAG TPA: glycine cleavage T C-terminal barrel domain-containing protein [Verrucomicrobiae bacterium]|nr:glycine cleavage T C-terminal barrel domain-containing protein [Verrucomicrobiae bacterium]
MKQLMLHEFHHGLGANFFELNDAEIVSDYGDWLAEYKSLRENAGVLDFSFRSRICLIGADRIRFLHGQITNDVKKLRVGEGCYAAITTNKGKMESDLNVFNLLDELLLDFEPGLTKKISARLEKFIVADDVQIVDVRPHYGLLSVQGQKSAAVIRALNLFPQIPEKQFGSVKISDATLGEIYLANNARLSNWWGERPREPQTNQFGFDLFIPNHSLGAVVDKLIAAAKQIGGRAVGWTAFETMRIENGIPQFGADMDETNIPLECGIENRAIVYNKGCYIGQEVINRIHSIGHVNRELRALRLATNLETLPKKGDKLFRDGKEIGYVTSAVRSPMFGNIALGYVRREANQIGTELVLKTTSGESPVKIVELPFAK